MGHGNVCIYCGRPGLRQEDLTPERKFVSAEAALATAERMNETIIHEMNMRVKPEDVVVHVGDFCTRGRARGEEGLRLGYRHYLDRLTGTWVLLEGNHDGQSKTKTVGRHMFCHIAGFSVFVSHHPSDDLHQPPALIDYVKQYCDFMVCGHVHEKWLYKRDGTLLNINVGVDQHKMRPVSDDELVNLYLQERKRHEKGT